MHQQGNAAVFPDNLAKTMVMYDVSAPVLCAAPVSLMLVRQRRNHGAQSPGASPYGTKQVCSWIAANDGQNGDQWFNGNHAGVKLQQDQKFLVTDGYTRILHVDRWATGNSATSVTALLTCSPTY